jgi:D-alanine-D-alanine ligase
MKKTIAVVFGGRSAEHEVSIITAHIPIIQSLVASGHYDIWPIYISKTGKWYSDRKFIELAYFKQPDFEAQLEHEKTIQLSFTDGLHLIWPGLRQKSVKIDIVFPSMHGTYGEDGSLMGLLRMANVAFVGCDMAASAVAMDKAFTKQLLASQGLPVVPDVWFTRADWAEKKVELTEKIQQLQWPLFVKPVHLGSSIGMAKVKNDTELENAIEVALHYDNKVLVEQSVEPLIELTLPIMGNDDPRPAEIERPLNKTEFFDFNDKYLSGGKKGGGVNTEYSEIPAAIAPELAAQVKQMGVQTYKILGCTGIARVDFLMNSASGKIFVNEVNTLPGSLYAHNWRKAGVSNMELVETLVKLAEERFAREQSTTYTFNSDILQQVGGPKAQ